MAGFLYPFFPVFSAFGFVLVLIPLPLHLQAWNSGTCYYIIWTALACFNSFVNSVVWANDAINRAPVWCDISTRITLGASVGIPAASMCIMRRLYNISNIHSVETSRADKRRVILVDSLICVLLPLVVMALAYIVQGHRFDIFEEIGCFMNIYNTPLSYFLVSMWPILLGLISMVYCALTLRSFLLRQAQFAQFLNSSSTLTASRYFRLMAMACVEIMCTTPLAIFLVVINVTAQPVQPWVSWQDTHYNFSRVDLVPSVIWRLNHRVVIGFEFTRWSAPACAILFFLFFGFAAEARRHYSRVFDAILRVLRLNREKASSITTKSYPISKLRQLALPSSFGSSQGSGSLPFFATPPPQYQPPSKFASPVSPVEKGFIPLASAGATSEFSISQCEKLSEPSTPQLLSSAASSSSRISRTSIVDFRV